MNPEQHITSIAAMITAASKDYSGPLHVCIWQKKIQVLPALHTPIRHPILLVIKDPASWDGLNNGQWSTLRYKIVSLIKECPECQKRLKSSTQPNADKS